MRADPRLAQVLLERLQGFAAERSCQPSTVFRAAMGYVSISAMKWLRGEDSRIRAETLSLLAEWLNENDGWRPKQVQQRSRLRRRGR